jgi:DNA gyrase subunit A
MSTRDEDFVSQVFVVNTHTPVLFFSSKGIVYMLKVYKLPLGSPTARGKAMINLLPLDEGETISTLMPMPEDEDTWGDWHIIFATAQGKVRRNSLKDFVNIKANGKIAMKFENGNAGDRLIRVRTVTEDDDLLLSTRQGKCIRFPVPDLRVFTGRTSTGVRGIKLAKNDEVVTMSALKHVHVDSDSREMYLQAVSAKRRLAGADYTGKKEEQKRDRELAARLEEPAYRAMAEHEEFVLTVTEDGMGKRTTSYEYRITGRGGSGITGIELKRGKKSTRVVSSFPVLSSDELVMVTDGGKLIRMPVADISQLGRTTRGVTLFKTAEDEKVVSVTRIREADTGEGAEEGEAAPGIIEPEAVEPEDIESDSGEEPEGADAE